MYRIFQCLIRLTLISTLSLFLILPANLKRLPPNVAIAASLPQDCKLAVFAKATPFRRQPLRFEVNHGQSDSQVRFIARAADSTLFLTQSEAVLRLPKLEASPEPARGGQRTWKTNFASIAKPIESAVIRLRPVHSNPHPRLTGIDKLPGVSHHFIGNDPRKWRTNIESYARVKYENLYPGIDLIYYGNQAGEIEYDFLVTAGANPNLITLSIEGADSVAVDDQSGDLLLETSVGRLRQQVPRLYQEVNGIRQKIAGRYRLLDKEKRVRNQRLVTFEVDDYDKSKSLVIDPVVVYSTLLGGAAGNFDGAKDVAVDAQGNAYIVGIAESSDFPTRNPFDGVPPQRFASKAFIAKFAPDGSLIYSTFLGGADGSSAASAIAVDASGAIYVAGSTNPDFPIVNAFQPATGSFADAFITKLNAAGNTILYSSFLGGNQGENVKDLKLDAQNNAYIVGTIDARGATIVTFPTVNPVQANYGGGDRDIFFSKVSANGSNLLASTYLGENGDDEVQSVTVSSDGSRVGIIGASDSTSLSATTTGIVPQSVCANPFLLVITSGPSLRKIELKDKLMREPTCAEILEELRKDESSGGNVSSSTLVGSGEASSGSGQATSPLESVQLAGGGFDIGIATFDQNNVFTLKSGHIS